MRAPKQLTLNHTTHSLQTVSGTVKVTALGSNSLADLLAFSSSTLLLPHSTCQTLIHSTLGHPQVKVTVLGSNSLVVLADLLASAKEPTTFDLGGRTLLGTGPLPPSCPGGQLVLAAPGITLRNGTLQLPDGSRLVLRGAGARLEGVTVWGAGIKGDGGDCPAGLVWVDGARGAVLQGCTIVGGTATDCSAVMVNNGATAEVVGCSLSGSKHHGGLLVWGAGSSMAVKDTKSHGNR